YPLFSCCSDVGTRTRSMESMVAPAHTLGSWKSICRFKIYWEVFNIKTKSNSFLFILFVFYVLFIFVRCYFFEYFIILLFCYHFVFLCCYFGFWHISYM